MERLRRDRAIAYIDIVVQLHSLGAVQVDFPQGLPHDVVRLSFGLLGCFDGRRLVEVALVVDV